MRSKYIVALIACTVVCPFVSSGQNTFSDEYERFKQQAFSKYEDFRDKCNQEYAEMLKHAWDWYQTMPAIERPEKEEELPPVVFEGDGNHRNEDNHIVIDEVISAPDPQPQPQPVSPVRQQPSWTESLETEFFGTEIKVVVPKERLYVENCTGECLSTMWSKFSDGCFDSLLCDCLELRENMALCDWAYLLMLFTISSDYYGEAFINSAVFLTAYLYCQSGYDMKLATTEKKGLVLLFSSQHSIYGVPYFLVNDSMYYAIGNLDESRLCICDAEFHGSKPLSLEIPQALKLAYFPTNTQTRSSISSALTVGVTTNKNVIDFYQTYPTSEIGENFMSRWATYANKPIDGMTGALLYSQLRSILTGADQETMVNALLTFVQTAFEYEYDDKVWGGDRAFFPEETLYYPYCDCEDRSIFFSRLIRDLVGLDVVLVYYPGHLATAVNFKEPVRGDYIILNGKKYVICDPTYIGAGIGYTMPGMDNKAAKVILLKND